MKTPERMRYLIVLSFVILVSPILLAQEKEGDQMENEMGREAVREFLKEKIRFPEEQFPELPTVGEIRARYALEDKGNDRRVAAGAEGLVSGDPAPESEVHAAINPTDSNNIVVSPIMLSTGALLCPIYYSKDFGKTWKKSTYLNLPPLNNARVLGGGDPVFAFDANGRAYFTWINIYASSDFQNLYSAIFWAYSDDGGETWIDGESPITIDGGSGIQGPSLLSDKQWLAVDRTESQWRDRLYVAFVELGSRSGNSKIVLRYLDPESMEFTQESVPVSTDDYEFVQFSSIDIDAQGFVHISFFGNHEREGW